MTTLSRYYLHVNIFIITSLYISHARFDSSNALPPSPVVPSPEWCSNVNMHTLVLMLRVVYLIHVIYSGWFSIACLFAIFAAVRCSG